jgi:hypothetical protein
MKLIKKKDMVLYTGQKRRVRAIVTDILENEGVKTYEIDAGGTFITCDESQIEMMI